MIDVATALQYVLQHACRLPAEQVSLRESLGRILADDVCSDIDSPPYDKTLVDGYALLASDVRQPPVELDVLEEVVAGAVPAQRVRGGTAIRIMTGAPIPQGADAVVMLEKTECWQEADGRCRVRIDSAAASGANIMRCGTSIRRGQIVIRNGTCLRAIELGLLAEVGCHNPQVFTRPRVAVIATGNELVDGPQLPEPGQIRNSNGPMLAALASQCGAVALELGIARDEEQHLEQLIGQGLADSNVVLLSGGVSAGVLDLVPQVLARAGIQEVFHKVHLKPGKPIWFGVSGEARLVFGLPGNPVSALVCFHLFVRPALQAMQGSPQPQLVPQRAQLEQPHRQHGDRPTYYPARLSPGDAVMRVSTLAWQGSADLCTLAKADCLAYFPPGDRQFEQGELLEVFPL